MLKTSLVPSLAPQCALHTPSTGRPRVKLAGMVTAPTSWGGETLKRQHALTQARECGARTSVQTAQPNNPHEKGDRAWHLLPWWPFRVIGPGALEWPELFVLHQDAAKPY